MWMVLWSEGGWFASAVMVLVLDGVAGRLSVLWTQGWDHVRLVGMQNVGKEVGRREVRGVGIGVGGM